MDIELTRFVRTEDSLMIAGSADTFKTIEKMKQSFKQIRLFQEVDINSAAMDKSIGRVKFNLKVML